MSNFEYDRLYDELLSLEKNWKQRLPQARRSMWDMKF